MISIKNIIIISLVTLLNFSCDQNSNTKSSIANNRNTVSQELEKDIIELEMEYFGQLCPCPQWITAKNKIIYEQQQRKNESHNDSLFYHIIPTSTITQNPFDLVTTNTNPLKFKFTGRFFKERQYINEEGAPQVPVKTFMYSKVEIISH